jgi:hypothetical protein
MLACVLTLGPLAAQQPRVTTPTVLGRRVELLATPRAAMVTGELLAAQGDSAWVLTSRPERVVAVPVGPASQATIRRHGLTASRGVIWGLVVGVVSGVGLAAACSSVADECGGVLVGSVASGLVFGALAGLSFHVSSRRTFTPVRVEQLTPYARFPQGVPTGLDLRALPDSLPTGR